MTDDFRRQLCRAHLLFAGAAAALLVATVAIPPWLLLSAAVTVAAVALVYLLSEIWGDGADGRARVQSLLGGGAVALVVVVATSCATAAETCIASHYGVGDGYGGRRTASGERMNPAAMTAAHRTLPFGSEVTVTSLATGRRVIVTINDRGPWVRGRCIDLSYGAAQALGITGTARVRVE